MVPLSDWETSLLYILDTAGQKDYVRREKFDLTNLGEVNGGREGGTWAKRASGKTKLDPEEAVNTLERNGDGDHYSICNSSK